MSRREFVSPEGLRLDGRRPDELRKLQARMDLFSRADGSAYVEMGNTKVVAAVYGPREVRRASMAKHDRAVVRAEFGMATFATGERKKSSKGDKRSAEVSQMLVATFEPVILTELFPRSQIDIFVHVLQADGGNVAAAINAATLALIDAGIPLKDFVVACSAGHIDGANVLDLNYLEDSSGGGPELLLAMLPTEATLSLVKINDRIPLDVYDALVSLAMKGAALIHEVLVAKVKEHAHQQAASLGTIV
ncbi:uncharacterized protein AMSG_11787 [Thecamonas trahens ATCC 50062]|uniref:Uncharacterized protein n=1 Tax=Thecamonas trahens ATCC 50062 TaxID=461836 RepID=A0A0L0D5Q9_THETB|nr:hypothetical protein AMSG_11787 [Thecamonas trahens ATCC 50062]KNC47684.1 hypothetical protein AMSG_11787 [Thecamonas trahens ATCC 50062]|eukprot:XP_013759364.1 hypothetical protein AMSG_11787 [Thecamonas trahens ATCC 50062]